MGARRAGWSRASPEVPYGLATDAAVARRGRQRARAAARPADVYALLRHGCWQRAPSMRPSAARLARLIAWLLDGGIERDPERVADRLVRDEADGPG